MPNVHPQWPAFTRPFKSDGDKRAFLAFIRPLPLEDQILAIKFHNERAPGEPMSRSEKRLVHKIMAYRVAQAAGFTIDNPRHAIFILGFIAAYFPEDLMDCHL